MAERAVPVLGSRDLRATLRFYESLGFTNLGTEPEKWGYMIVGRGGIELHFVGPSGGRRPAASCFVWVDDADALYAEWRANAPGEARIEPPVDTAWGMRSFALRDPDDNEIGVGSPISTEC
jgi:catechol 2,3-dioxygenase-like lactoylglutathione lyase family enzyme